MPLKRQKESQQLRNARDNLALVNEGRGVRRLTTTSRGADPRTLVPAERAISFLIGIANRDDKFRMAKEICALKVHRH